MKVRRKTLDDITHGIYLIYMSYATMEEVREVLPELSAIFGVSPKSLGGYLTQASTNPRIANELVEAGQDPADFPAWFAQPTITRRPTPKPSPQPPRQAPQQDAAQPNPRQETVKTKAIPVILEPAQPQQNPFPPIHILTANDPMPTWRPVTPISSDWFREHGLPRWETNPAPEPPKPLPEVASVDYLKALVPMAEYFDIAWKNMKSQSIFWYVTQQVAANVRDQQIRKDIDSVKAIVESISPPPPPERAVTPTEPPAPVPQVNLDVPRELELLESYKRERRKEDIEAIIELGKWMRKEKIERRRRFKEKYPTAFLDDWRSG